MPVKPLGRKAFGSTPHLPGSRTGSGDWHCPDGQALIATVRCRPGDEVAVSEKLDGSCCAAANIEGAIVPLIRAGYHARDSIYPQHHVFADWVEAHADRFRRLLRVGERAAAEWLLVAHGGRYLIEDDVDLFPVFEVFAAAKAGAQKERRTPRAEMAGRVVAAGLRHVPYLHVGGALAATEAMGLLGRTGRHRGLESPEGVVYRVETAGAYNFSVKYVEAGKVDGRYIPGVHESAATGHCPNGPAAARWIARSGVDIDAVAS